MPTTYEAIATVTVGSGGASVIEFASISNTYTDLLLKCSIRGTVAGDIQDNVLITFNGSSTGYSSRLLYGTGSSAASASTSTSSLNVTAYHPGAGATSNTFSNAEIYIPNYAGNTNKSVGSDFVTENNGTAAFMGISAGLWSNTAAITKITFTPIGGDSFAQYSTATLYGIKNS